MIGSVVALNAFGCPLTSSIDHHRELIFSEGERPAFRSTGVWCQASYINHSCTSNARRAFIGDMMIMRATRDMEADTEITFWYKSPVNSTHQEVQNILDHWGFTCDCALCKDGRATPSNIAAKRRELRQKLKKAFDHAERTNQTKQIEHLLHTLKGTYKHPSSDVPRMELWEPQMALGQLYAETNKPTKCLEWLAQALTSLGFNVSGADSSATSFAITKWGLMIDHIVMLFTLAKKSFVVIGNMSKAAKAEQYARTCFKIVVGEDTSFGKLYG